ncbi:MAG: DUF4974 domain-containing protein [Marinifilaceae bacterium]|nr:DUF4974 domain-containing protein [Marinifilaceae bacterium]
MDKEKYEITRLISLYMVGEISREEMDRLMGWVEMSDANRAFFQKVSGDDAWKERYARYRKIDEKAAFTRFERRIKGRRVYFRQWIGYAAAVCLVIGLVTWFWTGKDESKQPMVVAESIQPGEMKATLKLSTGEEIRLDGKTEETVSTEGSMQVRNTNDGIIYEQQDTLSGNGRDENRFNTLKTSRGGEYSVILSDGTVVYLNSASELRYPVQFNERERVVYFSGEGYFEVAKDKKRPFHVVVDDMRIRVYGTKFNVNTFKETGVQTVLLEGSVGISVKGKQEEYRLKPSQMAEFNRKDLSVEVKDVNPESFVAWKAGFFAFDEESLEEIMNTLARWYDVEVFYVNNDLKNLHFTGHLKRYDQITTILKAIESAVNVKFSVKGRTISVMK